MQFDAYHALLIGVGDYLHPGFACLPATVRDAGAMADVLQDTNRCGYPPRNVHLLTGEQATRANIRTALATLAQSTRPESTAWVYFSGHGGQTLEAGTWRSYLCPREATSDNLAGTAIAGEEFSTLLAAIPASRLVVILDACHAAGSAEWKAAGNAAIWKSGLPEGYYDALSQGVGRVIIASCKPNQVSYVRSAGDLSLFTFHLVDALTGRAAVRGDGLIRILDVFHSVNEAVQSSRPDQVPILKVKDLDLNFPVALYRDRTGKRVSILHPDIASIREQIIRDPIAGVRSLSAYLKNRAEWGNKQAEVDLLRTRLEKIQHDLDLFGPNPADQAEKNRIIYAILRICQELESAE